MIAVGALAADGRSRASFSNYGHWVDVYARGRGLVNAWGTGRYGTYVPPEDGQDRHFHGMARCSGTWFFHPDRDREDRRPDVARRERGAGARRRCWPGPGSFRG